MANTYKIAAAVSLVVIVLMISIVTILLVNLRSHKINCNCFRNEMSFLHLTKNLFKGDEVDCVEELFQAVKKGDFATVEKFLTKSDVDINSRKNEE